MKKNRILWGIITLALGLLATEAKSENTMTLNGREVPAYREGEVIVKYKDGALRTLSAMDTLYKRNEVVDVKRFGGEFHSFEHLAFNIAARSVEQVVNELERDPNVEYAQPNYLLYASDATLEAATQDAESAAIPGRRGRPSIQPRPIDRPAARDPAMGQAWGLMKIAADRAWSRQRGSRNVIVAVIDTGVDYNHPDLAANMWRNPNFRRRSNGVDEQASRISGDLVGWDFVHNDNLPYDDNNHGTHVSGTIGAVGTNGIGLSGVAQRVSIMAVKFLRANGSGDTAAAIRGIDYAISRGAKVLNNSWGGGGGPNAALRDAINRSERAGALFVAAAGNESTDIDSIGTYPASFNLPNMISVAATTSNDSFAVFSNRGARSVHMGAPGQAIYSTVAGGRYGVMSGTSMAAPHVAGAAAVLWAQFPNATYREIKARLVNNGDSLASLRGRTTSGKRLNLLRSLQ